MLTDICALHQSVIIGTEIFHKGINLSKNKQIDITNEQHSNPSVDLRTILEILEFEKANDLYIWNAFSQSEKSALILGEDETLINYNASMEKFFSHHK